MSNFRPTRASPPSKHANLSNRARQTSVSDISRSSVVSSSELQALTRQDIEFLDAVIQRASPTATTFLTVFKAYNDILNERGMDPQNEVVYYGKLLKLGTLKGKSWGDKWRMVKLQQGHVWDSTNQKPSEGPILRPVTRGSPPTAMARVTTRMKAHRLDDDLFTLHSHQGDSQVVETMINEDDAWAKVKMLQDEKMADRFREDRLVENSWAVWRSGLDWILTTNEQISQARGMLLLRTSMQRWRDQTASELDLYSRVSTLANNQRLRAALTSWRLRLKEKRRMDWQNDMRRKMKMVREKREASLRKDAWAKWRQSYRSHLSGQHYIERLVFRFFQRWKTRLLEVDHQEAVGDEFLGGQEHKVVERCWNYWKRTTELRNAERSALDSVGLRIMGDALEVWKKHTRDYRIADAFHDHYLKTNILRSWKTARDRIRGLENKAIRHLIRRDHVLLRAVARVWKARERGKLLEKAKAVRVVKDTWIIWHRRLHAHKELEDLALRFSMRSNVYAASLTLRTWRQVYGSHRNALSFAVHYHSAQLRFKMLLTWRLQLRFKLKMIKQARIAEKFFISRRAWKIWIDKLEGKQRQRRIEDLERQKLRKYFIAWLQRALRIRQRKLAEHEIQHRVAMRTMKTALSTWTNRVIELKLREIEVRQYNAITLLASAFRKWKSVCVRHVEELSLMESYQDIKREENMRRMFYRWLSAARSANRRRLTLQRKEKEMKAACVAVTWDRWRERFVNEKLRLIEYDVVIQSKRNTLFYAFGLWQSKTKSLPALRFHASHAKAKYWQVWRSAMPQALGNRKARDMDKKRILSKTLEKWQQGYKTKIALKAVARARYLRLPTSTPRQTIPSSRLPAVFGSTRRTEGSVVDSSAVVPSRSTPTLSTPLGTREGIATLLTNRPRSDTAISAHRPKFFSPRPREPSPTRTHSSFMGKISPVRSRFPARSRMSGLRELSSTLSRSRATTRERTPGGSHSGTTVSILNT